VKLGHFAVEGSKSLRGAEGVFAPRLSVVWSENEAGKAFFMRFIRQMLSVESLFGGEAAARPSGHLVLRMDDGRGLKVGSGGLQGLNADDSPGLVAEEMKYLCLAAAFGLKTLSFPGFMARMEEREKAAGPAAAGEGIEDLSARIRENEAEIEALRAIKRNYRTSLEDLEGKKNAVAWAAVQLSDERRRLRRLEILSQARPLWLEAKDLERALAGLGPRRAKPRDGMARLNALLEKAAGLQKEIDARRLKSQYEALRRKQIESSPSLNLLPYREALRNLEEETSQLKQARIDMLPLIEEASDREKRLKSALSDFSLDWTEKDLLEADLSIASEERAADVREALRAAERRAEELSRMLEEERASFSALQSEAASLRAGGEKVKAQKPEAGGQRMENIGFAKFEERRGRLLEIRNGLLRNDILFWEIRAEKIRADTLEEEIKMEGDPPEPGGSYIAKFLLALFLCFSGIATALEYLTAILRPYGAAAAFFAASIAVFPLLSIFLDKKDYNRRREWWEAQYLRRSEMIGAIDARIDEKRRKMQAIVASIEQKSKDLNIRVPSTVDDLDDESDRLVNALLRTRRLEDWWEEEERQILQKMDKSVRQKNQLSEELKRVKQETEAILEDWRGWLAQNRFDASLTPEGFLSFVARMRETREELRALEVLREKLDRRGEYTSTIETKIRVLSGRVGLELSRENLPAVFRSLEESLELKKQIEVSLEAQKAVDLECDVWEKELADVQSGIHSLCQEAGADDAAAFRAAVEECDKREAAEARLGELRRLLTGLLGGSDEERGKEKAAGLREWADYEKDFLGDAPKQAEELEELRITVAERENALERLKAAYDILERRTRTPFSDERLAELERENEALLSQSRARASNRLTIALAKRFAAKAAERGAKERRKVVRHARQLFSMRFFSPEISEAQLSPAAWERAAEGLSPFSDGEAGRSEEERIDEQARISLCLKLAAAYRRAESAEPIPLVLDDVLTRFDENRRHEIVQTLWLTSERVQITLLTAHPFTARLIQGDLEREDGFALLKV
jgi:uncharacterized protein YhaN